MGGIVCAVLLEEDGVGLGACSQGGCDWSGAAYGSKFVGAGVARWDLRNSCHGNGLGEAVMCEQRGLSLDLVMSGDVT